MKEPISASHQRGVLSVHTAALFLAMFVYGMREVVIGARKSYGALRSGAVKATAVRFPSARAHFSPRARVCVCYYFFLILSP